MSEKTTPREERLERQQLDDGDPDADVYLPRTTRALFYHQRDCYILAQSDRPPRSLPRRVAKRRWKAPCLRCVLADVEAAEATA